MEGVWGEVGRVEGSGDDRESAKAVIYAHTLSTVTVHTCTSEWHI